MGGGGRLAALAALSALALLLGATLPIAAQTSVTLLSNTGNALDSRYALSRLDVAQSFRTGSHSSGYKLTSASVTFDRVSGTQPSIAVSIRSDSTNSPGSSVGTLTNPASFSNGSLTFSTSGGIDLNPDTTYWLVFDSDGVSGSTYRVTSTLGDSLTVAEPGWSIGNHGFSRLASVTGSWPFTQGTAVRMALQGYPKSASQSAPVSPDPSNLARSDVQWKPDGGMHPVPSRIGEISSNKPKDATATLDLSAIAASVREELRERSRGFYVTTLVESPGERSHLLRGLEHELARGSPLLKISIWHVYRRASNGVNTVELLGEAFLPRRVNLLAEPVEICLPAPAEDAERARIAVRGRSDRDWTILGTTLRDGQLCAETVRVSRFVIVLEPEPAEAAA